MDECAVPDLQTEVCRYGCINTPGSYRCAAPPAELGRPEPRKDLECQPGYEAGAARSCIGENLDFSKWRGG